MRRLRLIFIISFSFLLIAIIFVFSIAPTHSPPIILGVPNNYTTSNITCYPLGAADNELFTNIINLTTFTVNNSGTIKKNTFYVSFDQNFTEFNGAPILNASGTLNITNETGIIHSGLKVLKGTNFDLAYNWTVAPIINFTVGTFEIWLNSSSFLNESGAFGSSFFTIANNKSSYFHLLNYREDRFSDYSGFQFCVVNTTDDLLCLSAQHNTTPDSVYHVVYTWNISEVAIYINGTKWRNTTTNFMNGVSFPPSLTSATDYALVCGERIFPEDDATVQEWNGTCDEVRIYNYVLPAEQIANNFRTRDYNVLVPEVTTIGDSVYCTVAALDNESFMGISSLQKNSSLLTVLNRPGIITIGFNASIIKKFTQLNFSANITDTDANIAFGTLSINISGKDTLNFTFPIDGTTGNFSQNFTINVSRGTVLNFTAYFNDTLGTINQNSTIFIINNTAPTVVPTITTSPVTTGVEVNMTCIYSDVDGDKAFGNSTYFYVNNTQIAESNNSFNLRPGNVSFQANITASCNINDSFDSSGWANSTKVSVGDITPPTLSLNLTNLTFYIDCMDSSSFISKVNYTLLKPDGTKVVRSTPGDFALQSGPDSAVNISIDSLETLTNGTYNITHVGCIDTNNNYRDNITTVDLNFSISKPVLLSYGLSASSIYTDQTITTNFTCSSDPNLRISVANFSLKISSGSTIIRTSPTHFSFTQDNNISTGYEIFATQETANVGNYNITQIGCLDSETNYLDNLTIQDLAFSVSTRPSSSSSGGGGGTYIPPATIINNTVNITIANCNFNHLCEPSNGEDYFSCKEDCTTPTAGINFTSNYLFCDDPNQRCFTDTIKSLFGSRAIVVNLSILTFMVLGAIVLAPKDSTISKTFKKPFFKRGSK